MPADEESYRDKWLDQRFENVGQQYDAMRESQRELREEFRTAVSDIKGENRNLFQKVHGETEQLERRFDHVDRQFEDVDGRFGDVDRWFGDIDRQFEDVDKRFGDIDRRLEGIDGRFESVDERLEGVQKQFMDVHKRFDQNFRWSIGIGISIVAATVTILRWLGIAFTPAPSA